MTDELLPYYNNELAFIRNLGREFAKANPAIAGRLRISGDHIEDPHVSRMVEGFAYLNARIRHKLEDDFPEITESFLDVLYPHFLAPQPSASIAKFKLDETQFELFEGHTLRRGTTLESAPTALEGQPCRFQTCYETTLWPIEVSAASFHGFPTAAPLTAYTDNSKAVIRIQLDSFSSKMAVKKLSANSLRFYLDGQDSHVYSLYEVLLNEVVGVAVAPSPNSEKEICLLGDDVIKPVGFERNQGLANYSARSFLGYRLLTELFTFPRKFLFVDIAGLSPAVMEKAGTGAHLEVFIFVRKLHEALEQNVSGRTFRLGCTPIVNLFEQLADPFKVDHTVFEHRVIPDPRRPRSNEIYSIDRVTAISPEGQRKEFAPFYSASHARDSDEDPAYWYATRQQAGYHEGEFDGGTEMYMSLVDMEFQPTEFREWTIEVHTTCTNRDLPSKLVFDGSLNLQVSSGGATIDGNRATCLIKPTPTVRPARRHGVLWKLISHLSLNHISLTNDEHGAQALREMLTLYNFTDSAESRQMIEGLVGVESKSIVGRVPSARQNGHGFCRGIEATITLDEAKYNMSNVFLFASVLERFLGLYSSINSFTRTCVKTTKRDGYLHRWAPRAGEDLLEAR